MRAIAVTEAILYVGMIAVAATVLVTQLPETVNTVKEVLSKESVIQQARTVANLLTIASSAPNEFKKVYKFPNEQTYDIVIKNGLVVINSVDASSPPFKTTVDIEFSKTNAKEITITKTIENGRVKIDIE